VIAVPNVVTIAATVIAVMLIMAIAA